MLKCATDLIATIVVLPDCIDRRNLVIASEAKQSRAAGQRGRWARDCMAVIRDLDEAREHHFGQHDTVDAALFHAGLAVIAAFTATTSPQSAFGSAVPDRSKAVPSHCRRAPGAPRTSLRIVNGGRRTLA